MQAEFATRIEKVIDCCAAALFACAAGFAAYSWLRLQVAGPMLAGEAGAIAAVAYLISVRLLGAIGAKARTLAVPVFDVREIAPMDLPVLLLTQPYEPAPESDDELVLDDILAELGPESRVVRLFDRAAMPTPGQLNQRIERHLAAGTAPADASEALHEALAELRRSLR